MREKNQFECELFLTSYQSVCKNRSSLTCIYANYDFKKLAGSARKFCIQLSIVVQCIVHCTSFLSIEKKEAKHTIELIFSKLSLYEKHFERFDTFSRRKIYAYSTQRALPLFPIVYYKVYILCVCVTRLILDSKYFDLPTILWKYY